MNLKCVKCKGELFQTVKGKIKVRTNILIFEKANEKGNIEALIKCPKCKSENLVPIILDTENTEVKHLIFENKIQEE